MLRSSIPKMTVDSVMRSRMFSNLS
ncbi:hypothetical protein F383_24048 [Gossypium arboreum]|uniref:Uncharacterized protein n=1 Tax=Gossypium arboreum TaxID=29729 RepID=A0A0B0P8Z7_GOSAR|nr:hypothetical protein F383_24048 [Gossypium arboreum]